MVAALSRRNREIAQARIDGETFASIGARFGVTLQRVQQIVKSPGVASVFNPDLDPRAPQWVKNARLSEEYLDILEDKDEFAAASHCRALLREMRVTS